MGPSIDGGVHKQKGIQQRKDEKKRPLNNFCAMKKDYVKEYLSKVRKKGCLVRRPHPQKKRVDFYTTKRQL